MPAEIVSRTTRKIRIGREVWYDLACVGISPVVMLVISLLMDILLLVRVTAVGLSD